MILTNDADIVKLQSLTLHADFQTNAFKMHFYLYILLEKAGKSTHSFPKKLYSYVI